MCVCVMYVLCAVCCVLCVCNPVVAGDHHVILTYATLYSAPGKQRVTARALRNWKDDPTTTDEDVLDSFGKNDRYYTVGTLFQFAHMMLDEHNSCFRDYLMGFDLVVFGAEVHDLQESERMYPYAERKARYLALAKAMLGGLQGRWGGKYRRLLADKLVWVSGISFPHKTPAHYRKAQQAPELDVKVKRAVTAAGVLYIDQLNATALCTWKNCTTEDNHFSRFVNRQKVLRTFAEVRDREAARGSVRGGEVG